jgi:predicted membrane chloride channel (bestrophin family)
LYGSVWPRVLPFCFINVITTTMILALKCYKIADITSDPLGHKYMAMLMAFLVVTRVKILYDNTMHNVRYIHDAYRAIRELVQEMCVLTATDRSATAQAWRRSVAHQALTLLRVTLAILEANSNTISGGGSNGSSTYRHSQVPWQIPELSAEQQCSVQDCHDILTRTPLGHLPTEERTLLAESCRTPILVAFGLRQEIMKPRFASPPGSILKVGIWEHPSNEELKLLERVADFLKAYSGLQCWLTTPLPFPLVQMTKTFLFVWIFTLPIALCHDYFNHPVALLIMVFLITYGFMGLEFVAIELSDTFGDDPSDYDLMGYAQMCMEDCYLAIYKMDGEESALLLKKSMTEGRMMQGPSISRVMIPDTITEDSDFDTAHGESDED